MSDIDRKLKKIMSIVFGVDENDVNEEMNIENVESWDSLKHMNLIVSLEEEFNIELEDEEIISMLSYNAIKGVLDKQ